MEGCLVFLIKLPFILVGLVLAFVFGLVGVVLTLVGLLLIPVFGVGLLILPFGLLFLFIAWIIGEIL